MNWQAAVETTVTGLGYELVDCDRSPRGLLRVFIDRVPAEPSVAADASAADEYINVDDCERVTRQLQHVLEVENVPYERLEVSSPGLDRPLRKQRDYERFVGEQVEISLKVPFKGRKKYTGTLVAVDSSSIVGGEAGSTDAAVPVTGAWRLLLAGAKSADRRADKKVAKAAAASASKAKAAGHAAPDPKEQSNPVAVGEPDRALDFLLEEVRDARLVPVVDFKGRRFAPSTATSPEVSTQAATASQAGAGAEDHGGLNK